MSENVSASDQELSAAHRNTVPFRCTSQAVHHINKGSFTISWSAGSTSSFVLKFEEPKTTTSLEHVEPLPVLTVDVLGDMAGKTAYNASLKLLDTFSEATCAMMKRAAAVRSHITSKQLLRSLKVWAEDTAGAFNKVLDNAQLLGEQHAECIRSGEDCGCYKSSEAGEDVRTTTRVDSVMEAASEVQENNNNVAKDDDDDADVDADADFEANEDFDHSDDSAEDYDDDWDAENIHIPLSDSTVLNEHQGGVSFGIFIAGLSLAPALCFIVLVSGHCPSLLVLWVYSFMIAWAVGHGGSHVVGCGK